MFLKETRINLDLLHQAHVTPDNLFHGNNHFSIMSHNKQELIGSRQQGGVLTSAKGEISELLTESGCDPSGLGRWNWINLKSDCRQVLIISACQCIKSTQTINTMCNQQLRYFQTIHRTDCPQNAFRDDLITFLTSSMSQSDGIILRVDVNEDSANSPLQRRLSSLGLIESSSKFTTKPMPSHFSGSKQIDGIWVTPNLTPSSISVLLHYFSVGDHRCFIADFSKDLFFGEGTIPIVKAEMHRLSLSQPQSVTNYVEKAELLLTYHKIDKKINSI